MEGLILIVAEFLLLPMVLGLSAFAQIVASLLSLMMQLILGINFKPRNDEQKRRIVISPKTLTWIRRLVLSSLCLFAATLFLINYVFFDNAIRFAANKVESKTGIEIQYEAVEGNLFSGSFMFSNLDLKQSTLGKPNFAINANELHAKLSIWDFILGQRVIEFASLSQANIAFKTAPKDKIEEADSKLYIGITVGKDGLDGTNISTTKSQLLNVPNFTIQNLILEEVSVLINDYSSESPFSYEIDIDHYEASPLRSHFAIFDLLFRSNLDAKLEGSRLKIANTEEGGIRHTKWATKDVPAQALASLIGGPFALFKEGLVDVEVTDQWESNDVENLDLDWRIIVSDAQAHLPSSTPNLLRPLAQVWVDNINENPKHWKFEFQLKLAESQFHGASSLNAQQIWKDSLPVLLKQASEFSGLEESVIKDKATKALDAFKGFIKKRTEE